MNTRRFEQARQAYEAMDYQSALSMFRECLNDAANPLAAGESGLLYHQIGNCLVKLNQGNAAIVAYGEALADTSYDALGSVNYNMGMAYAAAHDYAQAVAHFEAAVSDGKYSTPYKAYNAMGNALMKIGHSAEAGVAFREAALDERNPDPTKSLLNLGVCFMALDRPADAAVSYESALQFDMKPSVRNKMYANLGQAYVASGQMQKAAQAFEEALADGSYFLSASASVDYQRAIGAISQGTMQLPSGAPADQFGDEYFDGGIQQQGGGYVQDFYADETEALPPQGYYDENGEWHEVALGEERFFYATDEEIEQFGKDASKANRKKRNVGLKIAIAIIIVLVVIFGAGIACYVLGLGWPTQEAVAAKLFADPQAAASSVFAKDLSEAKSAAMQSMVAKDPSAKIDGVNKSMGESTVYVTATTEKGGTVRYKISMVRDLIGWKISNVEFYFTSQSDAPGSADSGDSDEAGAPSSDDETDAANTSGEAGDANGTANGGTASNGTSEPSNQ